MEDHSVTVSYIKIPQERFVKIIVDAALNPEYDKQLKDKMLADLGITRNGDENWFTTWLRHIAKLNCFEHKVPCDSRIADAIILNDDLKRFVFIIAGNDYSKSIKYENGKN